MVTNPAPVPGAPPVPDSAAGEDRDTQIRDAAVMRALAHPARLTILEHLGHGGPATATECAEVVGLTPSATSYHLRALARAGLIEQAPGRGDGRERLWRTLTRGYTVNAGPDADPEARAAQRDLVDTFLHWEDTRVRQFLARADDEPPEWWAATVLSESTLVLTVEELTRLNEQVQALIRPYRKRTRTDPPPGSRTVSAMFRAYPTDPPLRS